MFRQPARRIAERAKRIGAFVRVDMEGTEYTDRTLAVVRAAKDFATANKVPLSSFEF